MQDYIAYIIVALSAIALFLKIRKGMKQKSCAGGCAGCSGCAKAMGAMGIVGIESTTAVPHVIFRAHQHRICDV